MGLNPHIDQYSLSSDMNPAYTVSPGFKLLPDFSRPFSNYKVTPHYLQIASHHPASQHLLQKPSHLPIQQHAARQLYRPHPLRLLSLRCFLLWQSAKGHRSIQGRILGCSRKDVRELKLRISAELHHTRLQDNSGPDQADCQCLPGAQEHGQ